jgi:hypothetical protein
MSSKDYFDTDLDEHDFEFLREEQHDSISIFVASGEK